jgi:acetoacetyl-CoA reductase
MSRVALVTGGMGGLGEAVCIKLAALGFKVVTTYSPGNAKVKDWLQGMNNLGYGFKAYPCDVTDFDSARECIDTVTKDVGPVDVLVNNAGITRDMTFKKMDKVNWDAVMRTNLDSLFNMSKQVVDGMTERGWGRVINVSSVNGSKGAFRADQLLGSQAGVHGFTKALALEVAKKNVTVNTISPGYIGTEDGHGHPEGGAGQQDPAADSLGRLGKTGGSGRSDHLPGIRGSRLRHRRQHRHQRRPAHGLPRWKRMAGMQLSPPT